MSEYRDDRQGLVQRIADLEAALTRAEHRAVHHLEDALRAGELVSENDRLRLELRRLQEMQRRWVSLRTWLSATMAIIVVLVSVIVVLVTQK